MQASGLLELIVVTFNLWGLPQVGPLTPAPLRKERVAALCERLKSESEKGDGWSVVLLQEAWLAADRKTLSGCGFPHVADRDDPRRPLDSGLLTLSRYPIQTTRRFQYASLPAVDEALETGEGLARKSVLAAEIETPKGSVWFANTHLVAQYDDPDVFANARRQQFVDYVNFAKDLSQGRPLILGGDWNFSKKDPLWNAVEDMLSGFSEAADAASACTVCKSNLMGDHPERKIDHLWGTQIRKVDHGKVVLDDVMTVDGVSINYSDHYGWQSTFQIE